MLKPIPLLNLLDQAKETAKAGETTNFYLDGVLITPNEHIDIPRIKTCTVTSDFYSGESHCDNYFIEVSISPGLMQSRILPFRDDLIIDLIETRGVRRSMRRLRAVPLVETDPTVSGGSTIFSDLTSLDERNFIDIQFQLFDLGYEQIRNIQINTNFLAATLDNLIHYVLSKEIKDLKLNGTTGLKGVDIESPIDNPKVYRSVTIEPGTMLVDVANYFQKADGLGVYTRGLGSYYKNNVWFVYPLCKSGRYGKLDWSLDILKFPQDALPTIEQSYFVSTESNHVTILANGEADHSNNSDIDFQNVGQGKRLISEDAVAGDVGYYKNNERIIKTRLDSVTEYKTTNRGSKVNRVIVDPKPTSNIYRDISSSMFDAGDILTIEWHNSDPDLLYPGMPLRYYYMVGQILKVREGTLFAVRSDDQRTTRDFKGVFKRGTTLTIFLNPIEEDIPE